VSDDPDFFKPVHAAHLADRCPAVLTYLALPLGFGFLVADDHEDVWDDPELRDQVVQDACRIWPRLLAGLPRHWSIM
jgi:hypothetical protein